MNYIKIFHEEFPEYFEKEDESFLERAKDIQINGGERKIVLE